MSMSIAQAQQDMRRGYCSGATGIAASGLAWSAAAISALLHSPQRAVWVLLVGGMLIYPLGLLLCRVLGASGSHSKGNPLGQLAGASTFWLIFCLPLAWALSLQQAAWFFYAMLLVIGGRYLVFASVYGMGLYWFMGLALAATGFIAAPLNASAFVTAAAGAAIELILAIVALGQHRLWLRSAQPG